MPPKRTLLHALTETERRFLATSTPLSQLRNFLILEHSLALGTAVHGTPLIRALHAAIPGARVAAMASGFGLGVLQGNPGLEQLLPMPSPFADLRGAVRALRAQRIFGREPYAVLQTTGNGRTRVSLAAMLGGAHTRAGFSVHPELSAAPVSFDPQRSQIANNLEIVSALGHGEALRAALAQDPELKEPVVYPSLHDQVRVRALLQGAGIAEDRPLAVLITQTSPTQRKSWRPERFRQCATMLATEYRAQIVFAGAPAEAANIDELRAPLALPTVNLAGRTSLPEMSALLGMADVALTLDTGPMHLARAMRTPMVVIAPAWSPPIEWLPLGSPRVRILKNLDLASAPEGYVIDEVSAAEAEQAIGDLLASYPPGSRRTSLQAAR